MKHTVSIKEAASLLAVILSKQLHINLETHDSQYRFSVETFEDGSIDPDKSSITIEFKEKK